MPPSQPSLEALAGVRVVELPSLDPMPLLGAAMAAKLFADFGAEVIKVEPPRVGARERQLGPFRDDVPDPETGGLHLFLNTNKLGVTLDLELPRARELALRLLETADIVLSPNLPRVNERLELGWRDLTSRFPGLIVVSITPFGVESPYRDFRAGDLVATQMSGVGWETPWHQVTDLANEPPLRMAGRQTDYLAGYTAAAAAMAALRHRGTIGKGQHIDVSQWLAMVSVMRPALGVYSHESKESPSYERTRRRIKAGLPWVYPCKDGWVSFSAGTERFWQGWKRTLGNPEWMQQEIFATQIQRVQHLDAIEATIIDWLSNLTMREAFEQSQANHVPCFPVHTMAEVADNAQYNAREFYVDHDHDTAKEVRMPGAPCRFSRTPWRIKRGAPRLGEHNRRIFGEKLGLGESEMKTLQAEGAI